MSAYTSLRFVPVHQLSWVPSGEIIYDILRFFETSIIWSFTAYKDELRSDNVDETIYRPLVSFENICIDEAMRIYTRHNFVVCRFGITCKEWSKRCYNDLSEISLDIRDEFVPWDVSIYVGPCQIVSAIDEVEQIYSFNVAVSGNGLPSDCDEYIREMKAKKIIAELKNYLDLATQVEFDILLRI